MEVLEWGGALGRDLWHGGGTDSGYTGRAEEGDTYGVPGMLQAGKYLIAIEKPGNFPEICSTLLVLTLQLSPASSRLSILVPALVALRLSVYSLLSFFSSPCPSSLHPHWHSYSHIRHPLPPIHPLPPCTGPTSHLTAFRKGSLFLNESNILSLGHLGYSRENSKVYINQMQGLKVERLEVNAPSSESLVKALTQVELM